MKSKTFYLDSLIRDIEVLRYHNKMLQEQHIEDRLTIKENKGLQWLYYLRGLSG